MVFQKTCESCEGSGRSAVQPCRTCGGAGTQAQGRRHHARSSRQASSRARGWRCRGEATSGARGGPAGDLYVTVEVAPHAFLRRDGRDLHMTLPLAVHEAALGAKVTVPTLDGPVPLRIPPGTRAGQRLRIRGRGVPAANEDARRRPHRRGQPRAAGGAGRTVEGAAARVWRAESGGRAGPSVQGMTRVENRRRRRASARREAPQGTDQ